MGALHGEDQRSAEGEYSALRSRAYARRMTHYGGSRKGRLPYKHGLLLPKRRMRSMGDDGSYIILY